MMEFNTNKRKAVVAPGSVWETRMKNDQVKGGIKVFKQEEQNAVTSSSRVKRTSIVPRKTWTPVHKNSEEQPRSPIQSRKLRSDTQKVGEAGQLKKIKSDPNPIKKNLTSTDSIQLSKSKSELDQVQENEVDDELSGGDGESEKIETEKEQENVENCEEKEISHENSVRVINDEEIEIETEIFDVKEISIPEKDKVVVNEVEPEPEPETEKDKVVVNETEQESEPKPETKKVVNANMRFHHKNETRVTRPIAAPLVVKQSSTIRRNSTIYRNSNPVPKEKEHSSIPQTQSKLQSLVDLIMWKDVSRSAFVFGVGTFVIVSSSYAKDLNLSVISAMSYVGLVYLAVIFLYRSLICRGVIDVQDSNYVVGEKDAIWMLQLVLPYLNEFLSKLKALFSGDPGTTMKLAIFLFVLARCGSFITIWKMAKFGFFGVFIVPKICSSYSAQLTAYGNFWIRRFRDAWDSCTHKKAVALGIFGLVWNLSSVVARIWAVFVLFVAFRYYQQHYMVRDECVEDETESEEIWEQPNKVKKGF
ncbi:reticulon-like protein B21 isoform X1 [Vicia villosa]|uniref:reticulon-like protein B21 isoform X1 n=1 Tax=Vicia villosa TaxID=3911 RepID=UPI00273BFDE2|nr:reticulon-like protein B21 isoform X1 [Vicia villosa]